MLSGTSNAINFSSSAIRLDSAPSLLLQNNIFINNCTPTGSGFAAAYSRFNTNLSTYNASSNNNLFAGTSLFTDGTNNITTLAAYKTFMGTRDQASVTEASTPFISTEGSNPNFLRLPLNAVSVANNNALPITTPAITTDYFGVARSTTTPDIGASEFTGFACTAPTVYAISGGGNGCVNPGVAVGLVNSQTGVNYQLKYNGVATGSLVAGTGAVISFGNQTVAGTYTVDAISNVVGCGTPVAMSGNAVITLDPASVGGSMSGTTTICNGQSSGLLTLSGNTGTFIRWEQAFSPFTTWNALTNTNTTLMSGAIIQTTHFRAVSKNGSCPEAISSPAIITVQTISGSSVVTNVTCSGGTNGAINVTPTGGTAPYTFNWGGGITTEDRTGLATGTYSVTITDANGCIGTVSEISVISFAGPVIGTTVVTNVSCFGGTNGAINLTTSGGAGGAYTFNWSDGITTEDRTGLAAGTYSVIITNGTGCTRTVSGIIVTQPTTVVSGTTVVTNATCNVGAINLTPTGGTAPYTFNWGGGVTTEDRTGLAAGTYSVIITDGTGCTRTVSGIIVTQPTTVVSGTTVVTNATCNVGAINLTPTGGTAPYTFNWGGGVTTEDRTGLAAGTYSVTITDANGCIGTVSGITVTNDLVTPPTANAQTLCSPATFANLVATGTGIKWYAASTGGTAIPNTTLVSTGTYYVSQTIGGCESPRTAVNVTVNNTALPTATTTQTFNAGATVANLSATGTLLKWYNVPTGGTALVSTTVLLAAQTYYVSQTLNSCESLRLAVQVKLNGTALHFDGTNDNVLLNNTIPASDDKTYEAWVYPTNLTGTRTIMNHTNWASGNIHFQFNGNKLNFDFYPNNHACTYDFNVNTWYHVAAVYSKTFASVKFYVNGNFINVVAVPDYTTVPANAQIQLGGWNGGRFFSGIIDEVRIWNRALKQCEIQNNMNGELPTGETGLAAYYKFNQGIAQENNSGVFSLTDSSGNGNNGSLNNFGLAAGAISNWIAPGGVTTGTTSPNAPTVACYQTATFNPATCAWVVSGTQPVQPTTACYQTATFNTATCAWVLTGTQPAQPTVACYETATFDTTTCNWNVTGTQPVQPTLACYQTSTFNTTSCAWDVTGTQPAQPTVACYETATFNTTTCNWNVTGTQPVQPTLACYETATFNTTTCNWDVSGSLPAPPTFPCYQTATFNTTSCAWDVSGTQPVQPTTACYETATFNTTTCAWVLTGTQPVQPTTACYETATFNTASCAWDVTGTQPAQPIGAATQTVIGTNATIGNLLVTPSTSLWYASEVDALFGINVLTSTDNVSNGSTYYAVNVVNGCPSVPLAVTVTVSLSNDGFDNTSFNFYPNPTSDVLHISNNKEISEVIVYNLLGQTVLNQKYNNLEVTLDLSTFPTNTYLVKVICSEQSKTFKIMKK